MWITEFSTEEDWIELYVEGKLILGTYVVINADTVAIDTVAVNLIRNHIAILDQTNTSGFDLLEYGGIIEHDWGILYYGDIETPSYKQWSPAPSDGTSAKGWGGPPILWVISDNPTPGEWEVRLTPVYGDILLNEVYKDGVDNCNITIELFNNGGLPVNIDKWHIYVENAPA